MFLILFQIGFIQNGQWKIYGYEGFKATHGWHCILGPMVQESTMVLGVLGKELMDFPLIRRVWIGQEVNGQKIFDGDIVEFEAFNEQVGTETMIWQDSAFIVKTSELVMKITKLIGVDVEYLKGG